jgi:hypothetical protein
MPETQESTKQLLDISRNMKDIMSQVKNISADVKKGNESNDKNIGLIRKMVDSKNSPSGDIVNSLKGSLLKQKPGEASPGKKPGKLDIGKVKGIIGGQLPIKGALKLGGEVNDPGNYIVGEDGPEVVNLPKASSVIPLDVSDLVEGLSNVSEIRKSISDNKLNVNSESRTIKTENGDYSVDALVRSYMGMIQENEAEGIEDKGSALALTSLQKLSEKISSVPPEPQKAESKIEKKAEAPSQIKTADQKLLSKTKGPTPGEIEAEKKRLIEEDPDFYGDPKNLKEEIDYFINSYDFNEESIKKLSAPSGERNEFGDLKSSKEGEKSKSIEETTRLVEKSKPAAAEPVPGETAESKLKAKEGESTPSKEGSKGGIVEKKDKLIDKLKSSFGGDKDKIESGEGKKTGEKPSKEEKKSKFDLFKKEKKSKEEEKSQKSPGVEPGKKEGPAGVDKAISKIDANIPGLIAKEKAPIPLLSQEKKESPVDFAKILKGNDFGKSDLLKGENKGKEKGTPAGSENKGATPAGIKSTVATQLPKINKKEVIPGILPGGDKGKGGILEKGKKAISEKIGSFKETIEGKITNKISALKGESPIKGLGTEGKSSIAKDNVNSLKESITPGKGLLGPKEGEGKSKIASPLSEGKTKMEKSVQSLTQKNPEPKNQEAPKESTKSVTPVTKESSTPPKETKTEKPENKPKPEKDSSKSSSGSEGTQSGGGMEDIKGLLSQIAISLSSPVTFYNPDPFRPDSRRI